MRRGFSERAAVGAQGAHALHRHQQADEDERGHAVADRGQGERVDAVQRRHNADAAVIVGAIAFAALHVPLYGWHVVPLDFAVGLVLGATRLVAGTWTAPAIAHVGADFAGWWLL